MTEHEEKWEKIAQTLGIKNLKPIALRIGSKKYFQAIYKIDNMLNPISIDRFDTLSFAVRQLYEEARFRDKLPREIVAGWSYSDTTCVLKHVIIHHIIGERCKQHTK